MNTEEIVKEIQTILDKNLPAQTYKEVKVFKTMSSEGIKIFFAVSDYNIHQVAGKKIQAVSLCLWLERMELVPQCFRGNGGQSIYRKPNLELREEKFLAMKSVKIPFKRPKKELPFIYSAIERFCQNWVKTLKENKEVLMYQEIVNYDEYLK